MSIFSEAIVDYNFRIRRFFYSRPLCNSSDQSAPQILQVTKQNTVFNNILGHVAVPGVLKHAFDSKITSFVLFLMWRQTTSYNTSVRTSHLLFHVCLSLGTVCPVYRTGVSLLSREGFLYI